MASNPTQGFKTHPTTRFMLIHPAPIFVSLPVPSSSTKTTQALTHAKSHLLQNSEELALTTKFLQFDSKLSFTELAAVTCASGRWLCCHQSWLSRTKSSAHPLPLTRAIFLFFVSSAAFGQVWSLLGGSASSTSSTLTVQAFSSASLLSSGWCTHPELFH